MATTEVAKVDPFTKVRDLLVRSSGEIAAALPSHLKPERIIRLALTSFRKSPELLECDLYSLVGGVMQASQLGLEFDPILGHAFLVPFQNKRSGKKEAQLIIGYKGFLALADRTGKVDKFHAFVVHAHDEFDYQLGSDARLIHKPNLTDPGEPIAVYALLKKLSGAIDFEVIGWPKILEMQKQYGGRYGSPWKTHLEEMARKSAIRALAKRCPLSPEFMRAGAIDAAGDDGAQGLGLIPEVSRADRLAARIGADAPLPLGEVVDADWAEDELPAEAAK